MTDLRRIYKVRVQHKSKSLLFIVVELTFDKAIDRVRNALNKRYDWDTSLTIMNNGYSVKVGNKHFGLVTVPHIIHTEITKTSKLPKKVKKKHKRNLIQTPPTITDVQ